MRALRGRAAAAAGCHAAALQLALERLSDIRGLVRALARAEELKARQAAERVRPRSCTAPGLQNPNL